MTPNLPSKILFYTMVSGEPEPIFFPGAIGVMTAKPQPIKLTSSKYEQNILKQVSVPVVMMNMEAESQTTQPSLAIFLSFD